MTRTGLCCGLFATLIVGLLPACGGSSIETERLDVPTLDATDTAGEADGDKIPEFVLPDVSDSVGKPDGADDVDVDGGLLGHLGDPCVENGDCQGGYCVEGFEGSICTEQCLESCPDGYSCRVVLNYYPDVVSLCVPNVLKLCARCQTDAQCFGGVCVVTDEGGFCAADCMQATCPATYQCRPFTHPASGLDVQVCLPANGSCVCRPDTVGQLRSCSVKNGAGTCWGFEACGGDAGWQGCNASTPTAESCNGQDDDCDGLVDDDLPATRPCEKAVDGVGACAGDERCAGEAGWICDARTPAEESCNFQDDDCDGATDEDFTTVDPDTGVVTYTAFEHCGTCGNDCTGAIPNAASTRCDVAGAFPVCLVEACDPQYFKLNDFQCILPPGTFCNECSTDAECFGNSCLEQGGSSYCFRACEVDADCLGVEGYACRTHPALGTSWCLPANGTCDCGPATSAFKKACSRTNGQGTCFGFSTCEPTNGWSACDARTPAAEICNGVDDDCNGLQDDGLAPQPCQVAVDGVGACPGTTVCFGGAGWVCSAPKPEVEACNYKDDNCDGRIDEDFVDADGQYDGDLNCGTCNNVCDGTVPNGSARCGVVAGIRRCVVDTCDEGYYPLGDAACVKAGDNSCKPCAVDADCVVPGDRCLPSEDGAFCGVDCGPGNLHLLPPGTCPEGYACVADPSTPLGAGAAEQGAAHCLPASGSCTCTEANADATRVCSIVTEAGTCFGVRTCHPATGWSDCGARTPVAETCNGQDDDCDGVIDDVAGVGDVCARTVEGVGTCLGAQVCPAGGGELACSAKEPRAEACNYADDDCDGQTDEGFDELGEGCSVGSGVCLRHGYVLCSAGGAHAECSVTAGSPGAEVCNNLDDDCDGQIDEGWDEKGTSCSVGLGGCRAYGVRACDPAAPAAPLVCDAVAGKPVAERCNGLDDDCDGLFDDEWPDKGAICTVGVGACATVGVRVCNPSNNAGPTVCGAVAGSAQAEVCNGQDDNCNGQTDENWTDKGTVCTVGTGVCETSGVRVCDAGVPGGATVCDAAPGQPDPQESCDGLDDDCDGQTDEDWPDRGTVCFVGAGACTRSGVRVCDELDRLGPTACDATAGAGSAELCDGLDNDCDGQTDESWPTKGTICTVSAGACTATGVRICDATAPSGPVVCSATAGDGTAEVCNGIDDDCDGQIDENWADKGSICTVGTGRCRATGVRLCNAAAPSGPTVCGAVAGDPQAEVCNGLDDDCDGQVDEGWADKGTICTVGTGVCRATGVRACDPTNPAGVTVCEAVAGASGVEVCNGLDDDCDGQTDEAWTDKGTVCTVGVGTCLRSGVRGCNAGNPAGLTVCDAVAGAAGQETCDGLDDDCDGLTDEEWSDKGTVCTVGTGVCLASGVRVCDADAPFGATVCNAVPHAAGVEVCDGLDDDCDGQTDEGWSDKGTVCTVGTGACRRSGVRACNAGDPAGLTVCDAVAGAVAPETCNGLDDDCDGQTDEEWPDKGTVCSAGTGVCQRSGTRTCDAAAPAGPTVCGAVAGSGSAEVCDGLDDDCDGQTDEGWSDKGTVCTVGTGVCQAVGTRGCNAGNPAGPTVCNAVIGSGGAEVCNNLDDDCDGQTDEGWSDKNTVCTVGTGACRASGIRVCDAATPAGPTRCDAVEGAPSAETCDDVDNDCDGATDETWPTKGTSCSAGTGICAAGGVVVCDVAHPTAVTCNAVAGAPLGAELCNYLDDTCDGTTDEAFRDAGGRYVKHTACGNCFTDCTAIYALPNALGTCDTGVTVPTCRMSCVAGSFDLNAIPDDGCELVLDIDAIYVSTTDPSATTSAGCGRGPVGTGSGNVPCRTIAAGLTEAQSTGRHNVLVADGLYEEAVTLKGGVNLKGGYRPDTWERHLGSTLTTVRAPVVSGNLKTIIASGLTAATLVEGFVIEGASASSAGASSYAVWIADCTSALRVTSNRIRAGNGAAAAPVSNGGDGLDGVGGQDGQATIETTTTTKAACDALATTPGNQGAPGDAGLRTCGTDNVNGGAGAGAECPVSGGTQPKGANGNAADAGSGAAGTGGNGGADWSTTNCGVFGGAGNATAMAGTDGGRGQDGALGAGCPPAQAAGSVANNEWSGVAGLAGTGGTNGGGAGGGGAGGGADVSSNCQGTDDCLGGSGGGGGSGGCAGTNGAGGAAGGGSFAVFVSYTSAGATSLPVLSGNVLSRGYGGNGADGGTGGAGGLGGDGGDGGLVAGHWDGILGNGGRGGQGGDGGHGGGGGGGCGGASYALFVNNAAVTPTWHTTNTFAGGGAGGGGGGGGPSLGNSGTVGANGAAGDRNY